MKTYVINLDRCTERMRAIAQRLEAIGIAFERVPAVNGLDVPADLRDQFFIDDSDFTRLSVGEVGCYASHLVVFQKMLADGLPWALILEDDAIICLMILVP